MWEGATAIRLLVPGVVSLVDLHGRLLDLDPGHRFTILRPRRGGSRQCSHDFRSCWRPQAGTLITHRTRLMPATVSAWGIGSHNHRMHLVLATNPRLEWHGRLLRFVGTAPTPAMTAPTAATSGRSGRGAPRDGRLRRGRACPRPGGYGSKGGVGGWRDQFTK